MRDEFSQEVKRTIADRVANRCSNPKCRASTSGPQVDPTKSLNVGVAAHITAASPGGPRYNPTITEQERKHANNAIWLCQTCAKLVDNDKVRFTEEKLRRWKQVAETRAFAGIGKTALTSPSLLDSSEPPFSEVTKHTLDNAHQAALLHLQTLEDYKNQYGIESHEYWEYCNAESLIGHLPQWQHLYMDAYGAMVRPHKEEHFLEEFEGNIPKFERFNNGLILHLISGDSGVGKSTLAKLIIRRLILNDNLGEYPRIEQLQDHLRFFEISQNLSLENLNSSIQTFFQKQSYDDIYFFYFDDLFVLEQPEIQRLIKIFKEVSESYKIYLLATSPSWLLHKKRDLEQLRKDFQLITCADTEISQMDQNDRESLKSQYLKMYGDSYRQDLLSLIDNENQDLILLKLALHHNMHYSEYLRNLFENLSTKWDDYLSVFLLSCTVSRFYVHLPLTLIEELNQNLPKQLPTSATDYAQFQADGFKLFRIRIGNRDLSNPMGFPDTIAPFHDRIAQVAYSTWGKDKTVPIFNCRLDQLSNRVFEKYAESPRTRPIMANIFRGMLRVAEDRELKIFVNFFGPLQKGEWTLVDEPIASYRWIKYSKYNYERTKEYRQPWEKALIKAIEKNENIAKSSLALISLNPYNITRLEKKEWLKELSTLGEKYFIQIYTILDELLRQKPLPSSFLAEYLLELDKWLVKNSGGDRDSVSYRYLTVSEICKTSYWKPKADKGLNKALVTCITNYLVNLKNEYFTNQLVANIKRLGDQLTWNENELSAVADSLQSYVENGQNVRRGAPYEILLNFLRFKTQFEQEQIDRLTDIFWELYHSDPYFSGLTYTTESYFKFLKSTNVKSQRTVFNQAVEKLATLVYNTNQEELAKCISYPDFLEGFLECLAINRSEVSSEQLLNLLRLLIKIHPNSQITKFIFTKAANVNCPSLSSVLKKSNDIYARYLRIFFANRINLSVEQAIQDFLLVLESNKLPVSGEVCLSMQYLLNKKQNLRVSMLTIQGSRNRIYKWLLENEKQNDAAFVLLVLTTKLLFFDNLHNLEFAARNCINLNWVSGSLK